MYHKETLYTEAGLKKLAQIAKNARGDRSYREFEKIAGVSHAAMRRVELVEVKNPDDTTLAKIAPYTPYSFEELKAIAQERQVGELRRYRTAEDLLPLVNELPVEERARLGQMIFGHLARLIGELKNSKKS